MRRRRRLLQLLGTVAVVAATLGVGPAAAATTEDCGGGVLELRNGAGPDHGMVVGVRVSGVGAACDGQPVRVEFLGNDAGDPGLPQERLAVADSTLEPCTGQPVGGEGTLAGGAVEVQLCDDGGPAGHVAGAQLTRVRLLTPVVATPPGTVTPPDVDGPQDAPAADPGPGPLPSTGSDPFGQAGLGVGSMLLGVLLLTAARRRSGLR